MQSESNIPKINQWLDNNILEETSSTGFYLYTHTFSYLEKSYQRSDLFVLCELEPLKTGHILPHEHTLTGPGDILYQMLAESKAHLSPVFCLYSDPNHALSPFFSQIRRQQSMFEVQSEQGEHHTLHACTDHSVLKELIAFFKSEKLYIADGHHRYETAEMFAKDHGQEVPAANYILMNLTALEDPGLLMLPFHRLIRPEFVWPKWARFIKRLEPFFDIIEITPAEMNHALESTPPQRMRLVMQRADQYWLLEREKGLPTEFQSHLHEVFYELDVSVLHDLILQNLAGFPAEHTRDPHYIYFSPYISDIQQQLNNRGGVAFYLNKPPVQTLCDVANARQNMPPKSTYFYPKVPNGLLITRFNSAF